MKIDIDQIFQKRFNSYYREASRYGRLIASSGLLFTGSILTILGLIYYRDFLAWIPVWVPIPLAFSLLFGFLVTKGAHRTFLKEADILFLTPLEKRMDQYFLKTQRYNLLLQGVGIALLLVLLSPMYVDKIPTENQQVWFYFLIPILLKGWNLQSNWVALRWQNNKNIRYHAVLRFAFNVLFLYWFFVGGHILFLLVFSSIILLFYILERRIRTDHAVHWLYLVEMERRLQSRFYSFVNSFVDVPHLQSKVKKRAWISGITKWLPFSSSNAFRYLYVKTFFRANDYFGIYVRLSLIGTAVVYSIPNFYGQAVAYFLFLFLISVQLKAVYGHHQRQFWHKIFPLQPSQQKNAFIWLNFYLLTLQAFIMLIPTLLSEQEIWSNVLLLVVGFLLCYGYSHVVLKKTLYFDK